MKYTPCVSSRNKLRAFIGNIWQNDNDDWISQSLSVVLFAHANIIKQLGGLQWGCSIQSNQLNKQRSTITSNSFHIFQFSNRKKRENKQAEMN